MVFGRPLDTPPPLKAGYRRVIKVPIGEEYTLSCSRPNVRKFLTALRRIADVRMIIHANRDYALAMNLAFRLGFTQEQIFAAREPAISKPPLTAILLDDESECGPSDYDAYRRHGEKCRLLGIDVGSSWDLPIPAFGGMRNDPFARPVFWQRLVRRAAVALSNPQIMPKPDKEDPIPPYVMADFDAADPQARIEAICGLCLSNRETAGKMGVTERTILNRYYRDELISFPAVAGKNQRRFPAWQFNVDGGPNSIRPWVRPIIAAFGQNGWSLVEFLTKPHRLLQSNVGRLNCGDNADIERVIAAAKRFNHEGKTKADK